MSRPWWRGAVVLVVLAAGLAVLLVGPPSVHDITGHGPLTLAAFLGLYVLATLLPVPKAVFSLAAGALFGMVGGIGAALVGATAGATVAFAVARFLGREPVEKYAGTQLAWLDSRLRRHGIFAMLGFRLVPVVPFTALNYAAGITAISWPAYLAGTVLGIAPGVSLYVALGAYGREPGSWPFLVALVAAVVFTVVSIGLAVWQRRRASAATVARPPSGG